MKKTLLALLTVAVATLGYAADVADIAKKTMEQVTPNTITFKGQDEVISYETSIFSIR